MFENEEEIYQEYNEKVKSLRIKYIIIAIIIAIIAAVASSEYTTYQVKNRLLMGKEESSEEAKENINAISKTLKRFRQDYIDPNFLGEINEEKVLDETIKGYVRGLDDEYTEYMTAEEWEDFQASALGNYVGIGVYMSLDKNGNVVIVAPIKDSPAERAGLETGDIIVSVDDENVIGMSADEVSSRIKGEEGTKVKVTIFRKDEYKDFELERAAIKAYRVTSKILENNIGYISLETFDDGCAEEFKDEYLKLKKSGAKKIIIDLRNNTGGIVTEALDILDMIIPKGNIELITIDSKGEKDYTYAEEEPIIDCPIVVLANQYSASASEIMIGALKDNKKATIVGTTTYGKGVIQNVYTFKDGSALKITAAEYYTPGETKINKIGIEPDYNVELDLEKEEDTQLNKAIEILK